MWADDVIVGLCNNDIDEDCCMAVIAAASVVLTVSILRSDSYRPTAIQVGSGSIIHVTVCNGSIKTYFVETESKLITPSKVICCLLKIIYLWRNMITASLCLHVVALQRSAASPRIRNILRISVQHSLINKHYHSAGCWFAATTCSFEFLRASTMKW